MCSLTATGRPALASVSRRYAAGHEWLCRSMGGESWVVPPVLAGPPHTVAPLMTRTVYMPGATKKAYAPVTGSETVEAARLAPLNRSTSAPVRGPLVPHVAIPEIVGEPPPPQVGARSKF